MSIRACPARRNKIIAQIPKRRTVIHRGGFIVEKIDFCLVLRVSACPLRHTTRQALSDVRCVYAYIHYIYIYMCTH